VASDYAAGRDIPDRVGPSFEMALRDAKPSIFVPLTPEGL